MKTSEMINRKVDAVMQKAWSAFRIYSKFSLKKRASKYFPSRADLNNDAEFVANLKKMPYAFLASSLLQRS